MSISYASTPFTFVDSQFGTASSGNIKNLVNIALDRRYHKQVQKKLFFSVNGMIGPDTYAEGGPDAGGGSDTNSLEYETASGYPVIRKTDLRAVSGDTLKMGLRKNLSFTVNTGTVGAVQLVDSEVGWDMEDQQVKVDQWRQGVRTNGGINAQRNPYEPFEQTEMSLLSDWSAQIEDTSLLYTMHYGYAPHLFREFDTTNQPPTAVKNSLFGNDFTLDTTRTIANISGTGDDNISAATLEIGDTYCRQNDFDPVMVEGQGYWVVLVSPAGFAQLLRDTNFRQAMYYARERGLSNPLFQSQEAVVYSNCIIFRYDKIRSILAGNNPASLTVTNAGAASSAIVEASYTGIGGGVAATKLHQTYFLAANALSLAEGPFRMAERIRKEDDYQNIIGRAIDNIFGAKRNDWVAPGGSASSPDINQSLLRIVNTVIQ